MKESKKEGKKEEKGNERKRVATWGKRMKEILQK